MIDLYSWNTSNGKKISILLEEIKLPYRFHPINISKDEQFGADFLKISPNNRIPAIVDSEGPGGKPIDLFESGAILIYLAEKTGSPLYPSDPHKRYEVLKWLMWQMGGVGPMQGQAHHFRRAAKVKDDYGIERYTQESYRLYGVMDRRLADREFIAGDYSIADIAILPWTSRWEWIELDWNRFPNVKRWFDTMNARPMVELGLEIQAVDEGHAKRLADIRARVGHGSLVD